MEISLRERRRRYDLIRSQMEHENLDVLVVIGRDGSNNRGNHRYLAGYGVVAAFHHYIVFPRKEIEPVFFSGESLAILTPKARGWVNDIRPQLRPQKIVLEEVHRFKEGGRVGLVELGTIPTPLYLDLVKAYGTDEVRDARGILREIRLKKSWEEIESCRKSAKVADDIYLHLKRIIRPGLADYEIYGEMSRMVHEGKCEYAMNLINCGETNSLYAPIGSVLVPGGRLSVEITPAYEGYYTQLRADIPVSEYTESDRNLLKVWEKAYAGAIEGLRPGSRACDVYGTASDIARSQGYTISGRIGHALGLDADEFLSLDPRDETVITPGMIIAIHIQLQAGGGRPWMNGGTFLVTEDGCETLNKVAWFQ